MEFQTVINRRKMVRSFTKQKIPSEKQERILQNILTGPSAGFSQGTEILVLTQENSRSTFYKQWGSEAERKQSFQRWPKMENAQLIIIVCSNKQAYLERYAEPDKGWTDMDEKRWNVPYWLVDAGMAALLGLLTVVDEELGAVFTGFKNKVFVKEEFGIPEEYNPIGAILVGYPAETDPPSPSLKRGKRSLDEIVHYEKW